MATDNKRFSEKHVVPADGRRARQKRGEKRREARQTTSVPTEVEAAPLPDRKPVKPAKKSLRERRQERRRRRLRREGIDPDRPESRVRPMGVVWISWRWLSGSLTVMLLVVLYMLLATDLFYIESMAVGGERYLTREQIFQASGVANKHLFWVDPAEVEAKLEENPSIADAQVYVGWPPNMISVLITERNPVMTWQQGDFRVWVDANGIVMFQREERRDLVLVNYVASDEPLGAGATIDRNIIAGALQLKSMFSNIDELLYDDIKGLGFEDGRGWTVWFGTGTNMQMKVAVYDRIVLANPDTLFREIDVSDHDHPVFVERFPTE